MRHHDLAFIDLETTGFLSARDEIVELAVVLVDGETLETTAEYETLVRPLGPNGAQSVHRISNAMLRDAPLFGEIAPAFRALLAGRQLVGHNIQRFDLPFINTAFGRSGHAPVSPTAVIDTMKLARRIVPSRDHKLVTLAAHYGIPYPDAHAALADTLVTAEVFRRMHATGYPDIYASTLCDPAVDCLPSGWLPRHAVRRTHAEPPPF